MPFGGLLTLGIIGAVGSVAGGALANKSGQQQTSSTTPTYDPQSSALRDTVMKMVSQRLAAGPQDMAGYTANGLATINHDSDLVKQGQQNNLVSRGLGRSPIAGVVTGNTDATRAATSANFQNTIPLLQRQLQDSDLNMATGLIATGKGSTGTGTGTEESGGGAAGAATNLAQYLGYLTGKGAFGKSTGTSGLPVQPLGASSSLPGFNATGGY